MATLGGNSMTVTTADKFIPQLWSDEVVATYKKNLVMANLVSRINHTGKKGDTILIPKPARGSATAKSANALVTLVTDTATDITVSINKHYEYSFVIEDIVALQAMSSMRQFYSDNAGYALAKQVDTDLVQLGRYANNGAGTNVYATAVIGGDGSTAYIAASNNETPLTDSGIRKIFQSLDDNDTDMNGRFIVVPPAAKNTLLGISRYTEQAFVGDGAAIRNGQIGNIYGVPVYVSTNCDTASGSSGARIALIGHKDSMVLVDAMSVRTQTQYKQEYLGDLFTADTIYGVQRIRSGESGYGLTAMYAVAIPA